MAERTAAEVLAMLEDELAKQEAARQLFESDREPRPGPKTVKGIPEAEENLLRSIVSPFVPLEADVVREPQSTFETVNQLVPGASGWRSVATGRCSYLVYTRSICEP